MIVSDEGSLANLLKQSLAYHYFEENLRLYPLNWEKIDKRFRLFC